MLLWKLLNTDWLRNKMKTKKYHTLETVEKS